MLRRLSIGLMILGLLASVLTGCVAEPSPEEARAMTVTALSHQVPTGTAAPSVTATPGPQPQPTGASTATPEPSQSQISPENDPVTGVQAGQLAPDFALRNAAGEDVTLSGLRGQAVAMIFWASWCPYCQQEMPLLQAMHQAYGDQGLAVVAVDLLGSKGETQEKALAFVEQNNIAFPVLFDEGGQVFAQYQGRGIPNLIFIDQEGVIAKNYPGAMGAEDLEAQIRELLEVQ